MKELFKSLAAFQQECPVILKDTTGYGYKYADLTAIFKVVNPLLKKHGLGFYQGVDVTSLKTVVFHIESGESLTESAEIPQGVSLKGMNDFQVLGSAITYMRRYQLSAMLGIITDADIDAEGEQLSKGKPKWWNDAVKYLKTPSGTFEAILKKYPEAENWKEELMDAAL